MADGFRRQTGEEIGEELEMTNTTAFRYRGETANIRLVAWVPS
jgi:hypothetical protein